jgi:glycosyltransferase involved in cell wall biosynthesis
LSTDLSHVLVVIPAWNEELTVASVVEDVRSHEYQVLVVDDGSADRTSTEARKAGATVVRLPLHLGVGAALRCGFRYAVAHGFMAVVQCDADGQHPASLIEALVAAQAESGADLVIGSRFANERDSMQVGITRRVAMHLLAVSASRATGVPITDATSGFRILTMPLLEEFARNFATDYLGDTYEAVVTAGRSGYRVREIPITMRERRFGKSSASPLSAARYTLRALIVVGARQHFAIAQARHQGDREGRPHGNENQVPRANEHPAEGTAGGSHPGWDAGEVGLGGGVYSESHAVFGTPSEANSPD